MPRQHLQHGVVEQGDPVASEDVLQHDGEGAAGRDAHHEPRGQGQPERLRRVQAPPDPQAPGLGIAAHRADGQGGARADHDDDGQQQADSTKQVLDPPVLRTGGVPGQDDGGGPHQRAGGVPQQEAAVGHPAHAGQARDQRPQHPYPPPEQDGGPAAPLQELLAPGPALASDEPARPAALQRRPAMPSELVAQAVADHRGGDRDDQQHGQADPALAGEHPAEQQGHLPGQHDPDQRCGLTSDQQGDQDVRR